MSSVANAAPTWHGILRQVLKDQDIRLVTYVPDNVLRPLIDGCHADPVFTACPCASRLRATAMRQWVR